eukprot:1894885-Pleurochrysis_carterae.AAC.1
MAAAAATAMVMVASYSVTVAAVMAMARAVKVSRLLRAPAVVTALVLGTLGTATPKEAALVAALP